ncbi:origin of replication complex subunit 3 [Impatiens glandulifera]|uniref:origin of replication complex subunit 3 n=1 Tax=Impatiens glandulifera TaxID=253017 RepID=UPI001FB17B1B|nr:origin of replication complex subunit 3 [Impatiens glandulifera]XP_047316256.1 origin of replication complex subunit 3 [Impatiens glandulifera]
MAIETPDLPAVQEEHHLQPFTILHRGSQCKSDKNSTGRARRRIDSALSSSTHSDMKPTEGDKDQCYHHLRTNTYSFVWSKIETTVKDVLKNLNVDIFDDISTWAQDAFIEIRSCGRVASDNFSYSTPVSNHTLSTLLPVGLVFTKNMEFVDDLSTFENLGQHLKSQGFHVAKLSSADLSRKNGLVGCMKGLLRQFLTLGTNVGDISVLASWYSEQGNNDFPIVVIIDEMESCCESVLSDFILILREWLFKIPVILVMGVRTSTDALRKLSSKALHCLSAQEFSLRSPSERFDAIIEAVLVKQCSGFSIGHMVALFLRNYFIKQDGTVTSLVKALKIAVLHHVIMEPLSFLLLDDGTNNQVSLNNLHDLSPEMLKKAFVLPSFQRDNMAEHSSEALAQGLSKLRRLNMLWSCVVMCLYEAGKSHGVNLLDLFCEVLDPKLYYSRISGNQLGIDERSGMSPFCGKGNNPTTYAGSIITQVICNIRKLPAALLLPLLNRWEKLSDGIDEIHDKVRELLSLFKDEEAKLSKRGLVNSPRKSRPQSNASAKREANELSVRAAAMLDLMVRDYIQPIECIPLHEIVCFKDVDILQQALIGDPRRIIQLDVLEVNKTFKCTCCKKKSNDICPLMHETTVMYMLAQEYGDIVNIHDWYQSFKNKISQQSSKPKQRLKSSPMKKKKGKDPELNESSIQARFCRAVTELQITGLLRMPKKGSSDYVHRVIFGL